MLACLHVKPTMGNRATIKPMKQHDGIVMDPTAEGKSKTRSCSCDIQIGRCVYGDNYSSLTTAGKTETPRAAE